MRIAVVSPYALEVPGGVQQQVIGLVEQFRRIGEDAYAVAPAAGEGPNRIDVGSWTGVRVNRSRAPLAISPRVAARVREAVSTAEVVHIHEPFVPIVGWAALRSGKPTVVTFHADPSKTVRTAYRLARGLLRRVLHGSLATTVSRTAMGAIEPLGIRPEEIPNAIDVRSFRVPARRNPRQVAFVGRPDPRKGRDLLLAAWPDVRTAVPGASLAIIGGGNTPPVEGVRYLGRVTEEDKRVTLATSAVFCAPNRGGESFGITVAEGMAGRLCGGGQRPRRLLGCARRFGPAVPERGPGRPGGRSGTGPDRTGPTQPAGGGRLGPRPGVRLGEGDRPLRGALPEGQWPVVGGRWSVSTGAVPLHALRAQRWVSRAFTAPAVIIPGQ